jgi:hypothetical protein
MNESIDNNYGMAKDDMSIMVCKLINGWKSTFDVLFFNGHQRNVAKCSKYYCNLT